MITSDQMKTIKKNLDDAMAARTGSNVTDNGENGFVSSNYGSLKGTVESFDHQPDKGTPIFKEYGEKTIGYLKSHFYEVASEHCAENKTDSEKTIIDIDPGNSVISSDMNFSKINALINRIKRETASSTGITKESSSVETGDVEKSSCIGACSGICVGSCISHCNGCTSCTGTCKSDCNSTCYNNCSSGCKDNCKGGCSSGCSGNCYSGCTGGAFASTKH